MKLYGYGKQIDTLFGIMGKQENDITKSLSYLLFRCSVFRIKFIERFISNFDVHKIDDTIVSFQSCHDKGITDIEIYYPREFAIIIEAKIDYNLPTKTQLEKYANYLNSENFTKKKIVVLSNLPKEIAYKKLPELVANIEITYLSYTQLAVLIKESLDNSNNKEKELLTQYLRYITEVFSMIDKHSNIVYVVPISGNSIKMHDEDKKYICPVGNGFIKDPTNYIGFRFNGKLQYINHVESVNYFESSDGILFFEFMLGPDIIPFKTVRTGGKFKGTKYYCDIDLLLTCDTIAEACAKTKERNK